MTGPLPAPPPALHDGTWGRFRTLSAEHRVTVEALTEDGRVERHSLHGLIAVARPDRFRLRALGPGGLTLFDLLDIAGDVKVIHSLRDPRGETMSRLIASIASDLAAAYDLLPRPTEGAASATSGLRRIRRDRDAIVVEDEARTIRLESFTGRGEAAVPTRITIDNRAARYRVRIEATSSTVDEPLNPSMFLPR